MSYSIQNGNKYNTPKNFDNWSNSSENYNKASNGEKVEDFQLFKKDLSTYSSDLKKFSQDYIDSYDKNKDSKMDTKEFLTSATGDEGYADTLITSNEFLKLGSSLWESNLMPSFDKDGNNSLNVEEFTAALGYDISNIDDKTLSQVKELFNSANLSTILNPNDQEEKLDSSELFVAFSQEDYPNVDLAQVMVDSSNYDILKSQHDALDLNKDGNIASGEYASMLYATDLNWDNYLKTGGDVASSIDGKIDYNTYQSVQFLEPGSKEYNTFQNEKIDFYNAFYSED